MNKIEETLTRELTPYQPWISWCVVGPEQYNLKFEFKVKSQAKRESIIWKDSQTCPILEIQAKPVDGEANQAIVSFLAKSLGIPQAQIHIKRGHKSKNKLFELSFYLSKQKGCLHYLELLKKCMPISGEK